MQPKVVNTVLGLNVVVAATASVGGSVLKDYSRLKDYTEVRNTTLGEYSYVSQFSVVNAATIGRFCSIAHGVFIGLWEHDTDVTTHSFHLYETSGGFVRGFTDYKKDAIKTNIGHDVWIGANSVVLKGLTIGTGAIIGAGAVVTRDVPPYAIVVGNPAKLLRYRFAAEDMEFLLRTTWWDQPRERIQEMVSAGAFKSLDRLRSYFDKS